MTSTDVIIRKAKWTDKDDCLDCWQHRTSNTNYELDFEHLLMSDHITLAVAINQQTDTVIGLAATYIHDTPHEIETHLSGAYPTPILPPVPTPVTYHARACVTPNHRDTGIGNKLLTFLEYIAEKHGAETHTALVTLWSDGPNAASLLRDNNYTHAWKLHAHGWPADTHNNCQRCTTGGCTCGKTLLYKQV